MLQFVYKDVENVLKLASNTGHPCQVQPLELFFRGMYTWCKMPLLVLYVCHPFMFNMEPHKLEYFCMLKRT